VIPWNNLGTKPVIVNVKDVYVLAIPRTESSVSEFSQKKKKIKKKSYNMGIVDDHSRARRKRVQQQNKGTRKL
jgi:hypothetical protein